MSPDIPAPTPPVEIEPSVTSAEVSEKPFDWTKESPELLDSPSEKAKKLIKAFGTKVSELSELSSVLKGKEDDRLPRSGSAQLRDKPVVKPVPIDLGDGNVLGYKGPIEPNMPLLKQEAEAKLNGNRPIGRSGPAGPTSSGEYTKPTESDIEDLANIMASEQVSNPENVQLVSFESETEEGVAKSEATINQDGEMGVSHKVGDNDSNVVVNTKTGEIIKAEVSSGRDSEGNRTYITLDSKSPEAVSLLDSALSHITSGIDQATNKHTENIRQKVAYLAVPAQV